MKEGPLIKLMKRRPINNIGKGRKQHRKQHSLVIEIGTLTGFSIQTRGDNLRAYIGIIL